MYLNIIKSYKPLATLIKRIEINTQFMKTSFVHKMRSVIFALCIHSISYKNCFFSYYSCCCCKFLNINTIVPAPEREYLLIFSRIFIWTIQGDTIVHLALMRNRQNGQMVISYLQWEDNQKLFLLSYRKYTSKKKCLLHQLGFIHPFSFIF